MGSYKEIADKNALRLHHLCTILPNERFGQFVELNDGSLLTIFTFNNTSNISISRDDGATWSDREIKDENGLKINNICNAAPLLRTKSGVLVLVYMWYGEFEPLKSLDVWSIRSLDEGQTWVDGQRIYKGYCGGLNNIIQTKTGHIVVPVEGLLLTPNMHHAQSVFISADEGKSWEQSVFKSMELGSPKFLDLGGYGDHDGTMEATIIELKDGRLWMLIRTPLYCLWEAFSEDQGQSWHMMRPSQFDASNSPGYLARLSSGRIALVWNRLYPEGLDTEGYLEASTAGDDEIRKICPFAHAYTANVQRDEISIAFSEDEGKTWTLPVALARDISNRNLAYPYIFERRPGELWIYATQGKPPVGIKLFEKDFIRRKGLDVILSNLFKRFANWLFIMLKGIP